MPTEDKMTKTLNERDQFRDVVFRLMEWFHLDPNALIELEYYQAIMMDAGLMDREDYHVFLGPAREMTKGLR